MHPHTGCVNTCEWSGDGTTLATGSDDLHVNLYGASTGALVGTLASGHRNNIFAALFLPHRTDALVTTAADGEVRLLHVARGGSAAPAQRGRGSGPAHSELLFARRSSGFGMKLAFLPACPFAFLSTHQDGRVRLFDIREARAPVPASPAARQRDASDDRIVVSLGPDCGGASDVAFQPGGTHTQFALGCDDHMLRLFDLRALSDRGISPHAVLVPESLVDREAYTEGISGLAWAPHGRHVAVSYRGADVFLLDVDKARPACEAVGHARHAAAAASGYDGVEARAVPAVRRFRGRSNVRTFLKSVAFLCDGAFVTCGGDCGHVFVWHTRTGQLAARLRADDQVLNCVAPHPHDLPLMAVSGIDDDPKLVSTGTLRDAASWPRPPDRAAGDAMEGGDGGGSASRSDGEDDGSPDGSDDGPGLTRAVNTTLLAALVQNGLVSPAHHYWLGALLARAHRQATFDDDEEDDDGDGDESEDGEDEEDEDEEQEQ